MDIRKGEYWFDMLISRRNNLADSALFFVGFEALKHHSDQISRNRPNSKATYQDLLFKQNKGVNPNVQGFVLATLPLHWDFPYVEIVSSIMLPFQRGTVPAC